MLGTTDPPTARRLRISLEPGPRATIDQDHLCPIVHATATVNGVRLEQTAGGEYFPGGCDPILYELELTEDLLHELQQVAATRPRLALRHRVAEIRRAAAIRPGDPTPAIRPRLALRRRSDPGWRFGDPTPVGASPPSGGNPPVSAG